MFNCNWYLTLVQHQTRNPCCACRRSTSPKLPFRAALSASTASRPLAERVYSEVEVAARPPARVVAVTFSVLSCCSSYSSLREPV
jgi:hypothetical protein